MQICWSAKANTGVPHTGVLHSGVLHTGVLHTSVLHTGVLLLAKLQEYHKADIQL